MSRLHSCSVYNRQKTLIEISSATLDWMKNFAGFERKVAFFRLQRSARKKVEFFVQVLRIFFFRKPPSLLDHPLFPKTFFEVILLLSCRGSC